MKTGNSIRRIVIVLTGLMLILQAGCRKADLSPTVVTDIDGNIYKTITIGTQVWMGENLKTTRYNDGTSIPAVRNIPAGTKPEYCWYSNDSVSNKNIFGALYNWNVVATGKLCPEGWHVPSDEEWTTLTTFLGDDSTVGDKLKEKGNSHWTNPGTGANNSSGFTALPGGYYIDATIYFYTIDFKKMFIERPGFFTSYGIEGDWWSSSQSDTVNAWKMGVSTASGIVLRNRFLKTTCLSVRCVKDN